MQGLAEAPLIDKWIAQAMGERQTMPVSRVDKRTGRRIVEEGTKVASAKIVIGQGGLATASVTKPAITERPTNMTAHQVGQTAKLLSKALSILAKYEGEEIVRGATGRIVAEGIELPVDFLQDHDVLMDISPASEDLQQGDNFRIRVDIDTARSLGKKHEGSLSILMAIGLLHEFYHRLGLNEEDALIKTLEFCKLLKEKDLKSYNDLTDLLLANVIDHGNNFRDFIVKGINEPEQAQRLMARRLMNTWNVAARQDLLVFTKKSTEDLELSDAERTKRAEEGLPLTLEVPKADNKGVRLAKIDVNLENRQISSQAGTPGDQRVSTALGLLDEDLFNLLSRNEGTRAVTDAPLAYMREHGILLQIEVVDNLDHLMDVYTSDGFFAGEDSKAVLRIDSRAIQAASPKQIEGLKVMISMGIVFYSYRRLEGYTSLDAHRAMMDYFTALPKTKQDALTKMLTDTSEYDCCDYLHAFLSSYPRLPKASTDERRKADRTIQALRARSLAGELPFDLKQAEAVLLAAEKRGDDFHTDTNTALFDAMKNSFDEAKARVYYRRLAEALNGMGYIVTAQRGSRVSHTQATILSAAKFAVVNDDMRRAAANIAEAIRFMREVVVSGVSDVDKEYRALIDDFDSMFGEFDILIHDLNELTAKERVTVAEVERMGRRFEGTRSELLAKMEQRVGELRVRVRKDFGGVLQKKKRDALLSQVDRLNKIVGYLRSDTEKAINELQYSLDDAEFIDAAFTFFAQRFSPRSGHHIARLLLGRRIYIERDEQVEELRTEALSNIDIAPDPKYAVPYSSFYSENASLTVKSKEGKAFIDWSNMEQILLEIAPYCYEAIKNSEQNGWPMFAYQLETTVGGTFAEVIQHVLEGVMTDLATVDASPEAQARVALKEDEYRRKIGEAVKEVFGHYLLDAELASVMEEEKITRDEAIETLLRKYRDVAADVANLAVIRESGLEGEVAGAMQSDELARKVFTEFIKTAGLKSDYDKYLARKGISESQATKQDIMNFLKARKGKTDAFNAALYSAAYGNVLEGRRDLQLRARNYIKNYITYRHLTAARETIDELKLDTRPYRVSSEDIPEQGVKRRFNFVVKPSRIWFGPNEVSSVTSKYGQFIGGEPESVEDSLLLVELANSSIPCAHIFDTGEAGTAKVLENTVRDIEHAAATYVGTLAQAFSMDGRDLRDAMNTRKESHFLIWASAMVAGYCLTKEPVFVILMTEMTNDQILELVGVPSEKREHIKQEASRVLAVKSDFANTAEWEVWAREELSKDQEVRQYFGDIRDTEWMPSFDIIVFLMDKLVPARGEAGMDRLDTFAMQLAQWATKILKVERQINDTAAVNKVRNIFEAVSRARRIHGEAADLTSPDRIKIGMQASYKGEVSDYRESANWYMFLLLTKQQKRVKNYMGGLIKKVDDIESRMKELETAGQTGTDEYKTLAQQYREITNSPEYKEFAEITRLVDELIGDETTIPIPGEIVLSDPFVPDVDQFMDGELKTDADKIKARLRNLGFAEFGIAELTEDQIIANAKVSGTTDLFNWSIIKSKLAQLAKKASPADVEKIKAKIAEITKGEMVTLATSVKNVGNDFWRDYQGCDVIVLNSAHDELKQFLRDLPRVAQCMKIGNPNSDLVLIDSTQQSQGPLLDWDRIREWMALGGTYACLDIGVDKIEGWRREVEESRQNAAAVHKAIATGDREQARALLTEWASQLSQTHQVMRMTIESQREVAKQIGASVARYDETKKALDNFIKSPKLEDFSFEMWLALGGRWILNGLPEPVIAEYQRAFEEATGRRAAAKGVTLFATPAHELTTEEYAEERTVFRGTTKEGQLAVFTAADEIGQRKLQQKRQGEEAKVRNAFDTAYERISAQAELTGEACLSQANGIVENWPNLLATSTIDPKTIFSNFGEFLAYGRAACERYVDELLPGEEPLKKELKDDLAVFFDGKPITVRQYRRLRGDHDKNRGGSIGRLAEYAGIMGDEAKLTIVANIGSLIDQAYLLNQTVHVENPNELINVLSEYCDGVMNVHEFDYPPYLFHYLCTNGYGFESDYFRDPALRERMQQLSFQHYRWIHDYMRALVISKTALKDKNQEYVEDLLGDYTKGKAGILYVYDQPVSDAEIFWENMRALRDTIVLIHDRFPLPRIAKNVDPLAIGWQDSIYAAVSYPPGNTTTLAGVRQNLRLQREGVEIGGRLYKMCTGVTQYPARVADKRKGRKGQYLYYAPASLTFMNPEQLRALGIEPTAVEEANKEGVFTILQFNPSARPIIGSTMNHFTSYNHVSGRYEDDGLPVAWSRIAERMNYMKTVLRELLAKGGVDSIPQAEIPRDTPKAEIERVLRKFVQNSCIGTGMRAVIYKPSEQSGGRGSQRFVVVNEKEQIDEKTFEEMVDFAESFTSADDGIVQVFLTSSPFQLAKRDFLYNELVDEFAEIGRPIELNKIPPTPLYWFMRAFPTQSDADDRTIAAFALIANTEPIANYGRGGRLFEGTPERVIKPEFAKIVADELERVTFGCLQALEDYAPEFVQRPDVQARFPELKASLDGGDVPYARMMVGLFDFMPYLIYKRTPRSKPSIIHFAPTIEGDVAFFIYDKEGKQRFLDASQTNIVKLISEGKIQVRIGVIELNSGFGLIRPHQQQLQKLGMDQGELVIPVWNRLARRGYKYLAKRGLEPPSTVIPGQGPTATPPPAPEPTAPAPVMPEDPIASALEQTRQVLSQEGRDAVAEDDLSLVLNFYLFGQLQQSLGDIGQIREGLKDPGTRARIIKEAAGILKRDREKLQKVLVASGEFGTDRRIPVALRSGWSDTFSRRVAEITVGQIESPTRQTLRVVEGQLNVGDFERLIGSDRGKLAVICGTLDGATDLISALIADSSIYDEEKHGTLDEDVLGILWDKGWIERKKDKILVKRAIIYDHERKVLKEVDFPRPLELDPACDLAMMTNIPKEIEIQVAQDISHDLALCKIPQVNPAETSSRVDDKMKSSELIRGAANVPLTILVPAGTDPAAIGGQLANFVIGSGDAARLEVVVKPNIGTEGEGIEYFSSTDRNAAIDYVAQLLSTGQDILLQRPVGNARYFAQGESGKGYRRLVLRVNVGWDHNDFLAESGYAQVANDPDQVVVSKARGADIRDINTTLKSIYYQKRDGQWVLLPLTREHIAAIKKTAEDAAHAINKDLSEEDMVEFLGIDIALDVQERPDGKIEIIPVVLEANARPVGLSNSTLISDEPVMPDTYTPQRRITTALWNLADTLESKKATRRFGGTVRLVSTNGYTFTVTRGGHKVIADVIKGFLAQPPEKIKAYAAATNGQDIGNVRMNTEIQNRFRPILEAAKERIGADPNINVIVIPGLEAACARKGISGVVAHVGRGMAVAGEREKSIPVGGMQGFSNEERTGRNIYIDEYRLTQLMEHFPPREQVNFLANLIARLDNPVEATESPDEYEIRIERMVSTSYVRSKFVAIDQAGQLVAEYTIPQWLEVVRNSETSGFHEFLVEIYGDNPELLAAKKEAYLRTLEGARETGIYDMTKPVVVVSTTGRLRVFGGHPDAPGLMVDAVNMALEEETFMVVQRSNDDKVVLENADTEYEHRDFSINDNGVKGTEKINSPLEWDVWSQKQKEAGYIPTDRTRDWDMFARAIIAFYQGKYFGERQFSGLRVYVGESDVPKAGFSSSSSIVMGLNYAIDRIFGLHQPLSDLIYNGFAESTYCGQACGIADHAIVSYGKRGEIVVMGNSPEVPKGIVSFPEDLSILMFDSGISREMDMRRISQKFRDEFGEETGDANQVNRRSGRYCALVSLWIRHHFPELSDDMTYYERVQKTPPLAADKAVGYLGELLPGGRRPQSETRLYEIIRSIPERVTRQELLDTMPEFAPLLESLFGNHNEPKGRYRLRDGAVYGFSEGERVRLFVEACKRGDVDSILELQRRGHDGDRVTRYKIDVDDIGIAANVEEIGFDPSLHNDELDKILRGEVQKPLWQCAGTFERSLEPIDYFCDLVDAWSRWTGIKATASARISAAGLGGNISVFCEKRGIDALVTFLKVNYYERLKEITGTDLGYEFNDQTARDFRPGGGAVTLGVPMPRLPDGSVAIHLTIKEGNLKTVASEAMAVLSQKGEKALWEYIRFLDVLVIRTPSEQFGPKVEIVKAMIKARMPLGDLLSVDKNTEVLDTLLSGKELAKLPVGKVGLVIPARFIMENVGIREVLEDLERSVREFVVLVDAENEAEQKVVEQLDLPLVEIVTAAPGATRQERIDNIVRHLRSKGVPQAQIGLVGNPTPTAAVEAEIAQMQSITHDIYVGIPQAPPEGQLISVHGVVSDVVTAIAERREQRVFAITLPPITRPSDELQQRFREYREAIEFLRAA